MTTSKTMIKMDDAKMINQMMLWKLLSVMFSVTRLGDLLDFGQLFKAFGNN